MPALSLRCLALSSLSTSDLLCARHIFSYGLPTSEISARIRISSLENKKALATDTLMGKDVDNTPDPKQIRYHLVTRVLPNTISISFFNYKHSGDKSLRVKVFDMTIPAQADQYYRMTYNYKHLGPESLEYESEDVTQWFRFHKGVNILSITS